ncbi:Pleiotropic drug resistance protein transporter [Phytophthora megakarya]|uniref:Pleiotropic drug resistance protein transporter n=1 Tax=Phytophthora megakarya TaxID=4795 RepID=A0A225W1J1_9STRA|nr:Pleiotropic drug resistance protein transporter [Phytophthora megakarya]
MVAGAGKTPRHNLTDDERQLCLNAMLGERRERRIRRAEAKEGKAAVAKKKKGTRKKATKLTTPAMEIAETKGTCSAKVERSTIVVAEGAERAEAKATTAEHPEEAKATDDMAANRSTAVISEVMSGLVEAVAVAHDPNAETAVAVDSTVVVPV